jgi:hypothetical protein
MEARESESHHLLKSLSLLVLLVLKQHAIFFSALLGHVFQSVHNIKFVLELYLLASTVDVPANLSSFVVFVSPTSSLPVMILFRLSSLCHIEHNLLHTAETADSSTKRNFGKNESLISFDATRIAYKTTRLRIPLLLRMYSLPRERFYRAVAWQG